jgi:adenylate kinase
MEEKIAAIRAWLGSGSLNVFGMPFAGKDTQGGTLADLLHGTLMGGGEILRNSVIPVHVEQAMAEGALIPTEDFVKIVLPYLKQDKFAGKPLILSSVGRWKGEEEGVVRAVEEAGHEMKAVILLQVDEPTARSRHDQADIVADRGERADDSPEKLTNRFNEFNTKTVPVIDYYRKRGLLIEVDGSQTPPAVTEQIIDGLYELTDAA